MIDSMPCTAESTAFDFGNDPKLKEAPWMRDRNMHDVRIHLYEWHRLLLDWTAVKQNRFYPSVHLENLRRHERGVLGKAPVHVL